MITLKFCRGCEWGNTEYVELKSYKDFFLFYMENHDKGIIYDVELVGR